MRRICLLVCLLLPLSAVSASALTVRDVIELTRAGLSDEVLLALIEVDPTVFPVDTATIKQLKAAGVSDPVLTAMIRSGRTPALAPEAAPPQDVLPTDVAAVPPEPQVVVVDHYDEAPQQVVVPVAVPVYVPVVRHPRGHDDVKPARHCQQPVYWGFGGKLRPDAWKPAPTSCH